MRKENYMLSCVLLSFIATAVYAAYVFKMDK